MDVTVALAEALQADGSAQVRLFSPLPDRGARRVESIWRPISVPSKGDWRAARRARRVITAWKPTIVHAQDRRSGLVCSALGGPGGAKVAHTYHGVPTALIKVGTSAKRDPHVLRSTHWPR